MLVMQTQTETETAFHLVNIHRNNHRNKTKQNITTPLHHIQHCLLFQSLHHLFSSDSNLDISSPASLYIDPTWMCQSTAQLSIINNSMQVKITVFLQSMASYSISMLFFCESPIAPQTVKGPVSVTISVAPLNHSPNDHHSQYNRHATGHRLICIETKILTM